MLWYIVRDGKLYRDCYSRREARTWVKILRRQFPDSVFGIERD